MTTYSAEKSKHDKVDLRKMMNGTPKEPKKQGMEEVMQRKTKEESSDTVNSKQER